MGLPSVVGSDFPNPGEIQSPTLCHLLSGGFNGLPLVPHSISERFREALDERLADLSSTGVCAGFLKWGKHPDLPGRKQGSRDLPDVLFFADPYFVLLFVAEPLRDSSLAADQSLWRSQCS